METITRDQYVQAMQDIPDCVIQYLVDVGVPVHIKGFRCLGTAITLCAKDPRMLDSITKVLYHEVANVWGTTPSRVERAMRHAIERAFERCDIFYHASKYPVDFSKGKLTNSEFVSLAVTNLLPKLSGHLSAEKIST